MGSVEAAASLFGSSDSGSDLDFLTAPEGADSASDSPAGTRAGASDELFNASQDPSSLFDGAGDGGAVSSLFESDGKDWTQPYDHNGAYAAQAGDYPQENAHVNGQETQASFGYEEGTYSRYDDGWYDEHGQWHAYDQQGTLNNAVSPVANTSAVTTGMSDSTSDAGYTARDPTSQYSQYSVRQSNTSSAFGYQPASSYVPSSASTLSNYSPYDPTTPALQQSMSPYTASAPASSYDPYRPSGGSTQQGPMASVSYADIPSSTHEPYRPAVPTTRSLPAGQSPGQSQSTTFTSGDSLIPPPNTVGSSKPPAAPYRPSTLNAYDPPLPAVKPKKSMASNALQYQYQGSPYGPQGVISPPLPPPPPPTHSAFSPPRRSSTLTPGSRSPTRASAYSPPKRSDVSYAQSSSNIEHSASPYDPPLSRHHEPPKPGTYGHEQHAKSQSNGYYTSTALASSLNGQLPVDTTSTAHVYGVANGSHKDKGSQRSFSPHHDNNAYSSRQDDADVTMVQSNFEGLDIEREEGIFYPVTSGSETVEADAAQKPTSPVSRHTKARQSPPADLHAYPSPEAPPRSREKSQRIISPVSESGRSPSSSVGGSSPFNARAGSNLTGQSFSALDEQAQHNEPYDFMKISSIDRVSSPGARSVESLGGYEVPPLILSSNSNLPQDQNAVDLFNGSTPYIRTASSSIPSTVSTLPNSNKIYDSYKPKQTEKNAPKLHSDASFTSSSDSYTFSYQYASPQQGYEAPALRERSMSNMSSFSTSSATSYDPYAPSCQTGKRFEPSQYGSSATAPSFGPTVNGNGRASMESSYSPPPLTGPYAPSPSLLGTNDPLGRANVKVPVVNFGFGGKLITCFHSPPILDTGFDVALSSRKCTDVHIRTLRKAIPESALDVSSIAYPGPLFGDPGSPVSTLVRSATTANAKSKTKKAKVLAYLDERMEELEKGLGYLSAGSADKRRADGKLTLVRLLRVLVEYDGQLHGSPSAESEVQAALLPRLATSRDATASRAFLNAPTAAAIASGTFGSASSNENPLAEYAVRPFALDTLQDFLMRGEKRKAYHYALDEKMWAHAMVISCSIDKEAFKEVVNEFVRTELGVKVGRPDAPVTNGYESLRLAYSLYSGQSSSAVQHILPTKSLQAGPSLTLQPPTPMNHMTPLSPNFPPPTLATNISPEIMSQWQEYAVMLFSGQMGTESSTALTTLGDYLLSNDWIEAAHCCYLLSPQSSPIGGVGAPSVRIVLVGSHSPHRNVSFAADPDPFIFSEILEFALSLHAPAKGQEAFTGFPHLQVYRLIRAVQLAEMGQMSLAKKYCEAITGAAFRSSPYLSQLFSDQLRELFNRLNGDPELDKANSWIGGKIAKPSLDSIGDWLGGTLSKFVAGEAEPSSPVTGQRLANDPAYSGTFAQFSNISSTNNSRRSSPAPSFVNSGTLSGSLAGRAVSVLAVRPFTTNDRASSVMDYERPELRKDTPPPRVLSADSHASSFGQLQNMSQGIAGNDYQSNQNERHIGNGDASHSEESRKSEDGGWWSSAFGGADKATPTASSFSYSNSQAMETESGGSEFISLMDNYSSFTPSPSATTFTNGKVHDANGSNDDDDLGLGNSSSKKKKETVQEAESENKEEKEVQKEEPKKPDLPKSQSWFPFRLFSRPSSTNPGPVKANLGEETSFYYDKELKRWVNKKAGAETPKPAAPPAPPSRAQTASPSRALQSWSAGPPPPSPMLPLGRPQSAMDAGSSPPPKKTLPRVHSNLIPEEDHTVPKSAPPTPAAISSLSAPPLTSRPKSAAKKSVRSRYVDVFQQPS